VDDLLLQLAADVAAAGGDRVRGADVRVGGHRHDVGRLGDEEAGRVRPGAPGGDVDGHRDAGVEQGADHVVHRGGDAARRVHDRHEEVRVLGLRPLDGLADVGGGGGVDVAVQGGANDERRR